MLDIQENTQTLPLDTCQNLCGHYQLGRLEVPPEVITGGRVHRVWKLTTNNGVYAVKRLHPRLITECEALTTYHHTEQIAALALEKEIPTVTALSPFGEVIFHENVEDAYMVFPWVNAQSFTVSDISLTQAQTVGQLLGKIHQLDYQSGPLSNIGLALPETPYPVFSEAHWKALVQQCEDVYFPESNQLAALLPDCLNIQQLGVTGYHNLKSNQVLGHGDLDNRNILWIDKQSPIIIDWEYAGLKNPLMELMGVGLYWSIGEDYELSLSQWRAIFDGYRQSGAVIQGNFQDAFYALLGTWLEWLEFNLRRVIGELILDHYELRIAEREARHSLRAIQLVLSEKDNLFENI